MTWTIKDGYIGKAILQLDYTTGDASDNLISSETHQYTIDTDGNIEYVKITGFDEELSFSFSGR
ncbi:hypothetical protein QCB44_08805 [Thiomicrorhabdus sp. zzn3]|uniref:hypothetical protein n=1 Tax=Thiomicrorhabdus sp. zzn3 TaxID=3039775 RepID=UPI002437160C|nr:hypothetical protein [Thiomicrorhabdus sp. zzn3]MDG6778803.1 hypothetical protein [Thiomicrorhabdus sp. zzn3]